VERNVTQQQANTRLDQLRAELERILPLVIREYKPERVLLFGSAVSGVVTEWSDLDIVIVKETEKRFYDRLAEVMKVIRPRVGIDILVYTPAEWQQLSAENAFIREEVLKRGRLLYAA